MSIFRPNQKVILDHPDGTQTVWEGFALTERGAIRQADRKAALEKTGKTGKRAEGKRTS